MTSSSDFDSAQSITETLRKRRPLLELLADGSLDQRDLRSELDRSRSTVYKALRELEDAGLVVRRGDAYALTGFGRLVWQRHDDYIARLRGLMEARPLLETLPVDRQPPLAVFERGRVVVPTRGAPERPLECLEARSDRCERFRCVSPAGMPRYLEDLHKDADAGEKTAELVVETDALARLKEGYADFEEAVDTPGLDMWVTERTLPYALVLFDDDSLGLFVYDEGVLVGAAFSGDKEALQWGETAYRRHRDAADRV